MSSRREVLIRILALLQRKTLIETKNRTLKWHYWTVRSIKNVALLTEDGAFALFFRPHPGGFDSSRVPTPGNLPSKAKKVPMPGGHPRGRGGRGWAQVELADALDPSQIEPPILSPAILSCSIFFSLIRYCFLCCFFFFFHQGLIQTSLTELGTSD